MSFSKARIQRFNELENNVPAPGAYDPKFDNKVKGLVIEKTERFQDNKSAVSAECNVSVSNASIGNVTMGFRTPQLPRKKQSARPTVLCSKGRTRCQLQLTGQKLKYESQHELADLQIECTNKDKTIHEQEKHIDDMKEQVRHLEDQLEELVRKQLDVQEQHKKDIEIMAKLQQDVLNDRQVKLEQGEMQSLRSQLVAITEEKERESQARMVVEGELRDRLAEFTDRIVSLESELIDAKKANEEKVLMLKTKIEELTTNLENLNEERKREVNDLTEEFEVKLEKRQNVNLELQAQLSTLQCELDELKAEYDKLIEDSAKNISELENVHHEEINQLRTAFEQEKENICNESECKTTLLLQAEIRSKEIDEENAFLKTELKDVQTLYKDLSNRLSDAHKELEEADKKHAALLKKHQEDLNEIRNIHDQEKLSLNEMLENAKMDYLKEKENMTLARAKEVAELREACDKQIEEETKRIKEHAEKRIENAEAVTKETLAACRDESEKKVKQVIAECDAKMNTMMREARHAVEEEMRLTAERYKTCLARVEMERVALDEKLAQRDAEISKLSATLEELRSSAETQESFGQSLQNELDRAEAELAEKKEELRALKTQIRTEAAQMVARKKRFEVIMAENQASVAALSKRLAQSNAEVERLQHELKRGEDCIHEHRDLLSIMRNNSQMVQEQVHALMEHLDAKKGLVDQLEADSLTEITSIKAVFEAKIEDLKQIAAKEITRLQAACDEKNTQNTDIKKQLDEMATRLTEAQKMLLTLEETNDAQNLEISRMELRNTKLEEQLNATKILMEDTNKLLEMQSEQQKIAEEQDRINLLEEERSQWESIEKAIRDELEEERARREAADEEIRKLVKDHQEISEKYAELIGHQNHRQRIKHVSQLKDKIYQLEQELLGKSRSLEQRQKIMDQQQKTIDQQHKTIEKLKAEDKRVPSKGKENVLGIPKSAQSTPVSSPHKTPLRNRNDL